MEYQQGLERQQEMEEKKLAHYRETMDRLTAAAHVKVEYFAEHQKIEGYYEDRIPENLFGCDRLMKQDNQFGTIQLGYNPNRKRTFLFANLKTSRYDTVASRYQKEMRDYRRRSLLKGDNENRAYVSRRDEMASILIEKKERKPWTARSVKTYLNRTNMEAAAKLLPFFSREEEREELEEFYSRRKEIQEEIRKLRGKEQASARDGQEEPEELAARRQEASEEIRILRREATDSLAKESLLETLLARKSAAAKLFLRRINYAYDFQKKDIEEYYRERRRALERAAAEETQEDMPEDEDE